MEYFYTVTQFAQLTGKDPGNIRRLLISGKIPGEKIGNQWVIPKGTTYPADARVKSGNYRNWRKRSDIRRAKPYLIKTLLKISSDLQEVYQEYLEKTILYGAYARGDQTKESPVEIAVILHKGHTKEMHEAMIDVVVEYGMYQGITLSVIPIEYEQYETWNKSLPFYKKLDEEGIVLWKAKQTEC